MLSVVNSFAGCIGKNKAMAVLDTTVINGKSSLFYYISSSNIIETDYYSIKNIIFMDSTLNCINSSNGRLVCGDIKGVGYVIELGNKYKADCNEKIQDCCFVDEDTVAFSTFQSIVLFKYKESKTTIHNMDFIIKSIQIVQTSLLIGSITGGLHIYSILSDQNALKFVEKIDAHCDSITDIKVYNNELVATCSQDMNVKIWKFGTGAKVYSNELIAACSLDTSVEGCNCNTEISLIQTLNGHTDWVNCLAWNDSILYSASSDKTIRVWERNEDNKIGENGFYVCTDIIGGSSEFLDVVVYENRLLGHSKTGGIDKLLDREYFVSGHLNEVTDLDWKNGFLLSCSLDKTSRIFYKGKECGRPQTHGYPLTSSKFLPGDKLRYISSGQETILRMYEATQNFLLNCLEAKEICLDESEDSFDFDEHFDEYVETAYLCELNLTNEVADENEQEPLSENSLSTNTFREYRKIYGHYFEIKNIAVGESIILSCNRSAAKNFAGVFMWTLDGAKLQYEADHDLGIQKIAMDRLDKLALTVSRDKTACLYSINNSKLALFKKFTDHERIVWDCGFSRDSKYFATCSRDGRVILYNTESLDIKQSMAFQAELTALEFSPVNDLLLIGTDSGIIKVLDYNLAVIEELRVVGKTVNALKFDRKGKKIAVGGSDGLLRILNLS